MSVQLQARFDGERVEVEMRDMTEAQAAAHNARIRAQRQGLSPAIPCPPPVLKLRPRASVMAVGRVLRVELAIPPSTNNAYTSVLGVGRVLSIQGRKYKASAEGAIEAAALLQKFRLEPHARLSLSIYLMFPSKRRRDISNCVKLIEDSLANALGFDDKLIDVLHVERRTYAIGGPSCEVVLTVIEAG